MLIAIKSLSQNQRGPAYMEALLRSLHQGNLRRLPIRLAYASDGQLVNLYCQFPDELRRDVLGQMQDAYPDCAVNVIPEHSLNPQEKTVVFTRFLRLSPDVLSLCHFHEFEDHLQRELAEPATNLLSAVRSDHERGLRSIIELTIRPCTSMRQRQARSILRRYQGTFRFRFLAERFVRMATSPRRIVRWASVPIGLTALRHKHADDATERDSLSQHLFVCQLRLSVNGDKSKGRSARNKLQQLQGALGTFTSQSPCFVRSNSRQRGFLLSAPEVATLFHPPVSTAAVSRLDRATFRELEPPPLLPSKKREADVTEVGHVRFRGQRQRFGIRSDDLRRHVFMCGRTGTGKSTLIRSMVLDSLHSNRAVCVIDPHGDLVESILDCVPNHRTNHVAYFSAADRDRPVAFNPLHCPSPDKRPLVADSLLMAFKKLYGDSWGPRLEQILRNSLLALLEQNAPTLLCVRQLLTDRAYRGSVVSRISDPVVRSFWTDTFGSWNARFQTEAVSPVLNKLDGFLANPIARAITCQSRSTIDIRKLIDDPNTILLCNLSKGLVGEQTSNLLGAFLVTALQTAALSRADMPEEHRNDVQVYIDEFHSFVSEGNNAFATILSESRKYRVAFAALATQFLDQIDEETLAAVLGNCGSTIAFRCGVRDSETLAAHLGTVAPEDIVNLPNFTAYAKLLIGGQPTRNPFSMTVNMNAPGTGRRGNIVREVSRRKHGRAANHVNAELNAQLAVT